MGRIQLEIGYQQHCDTWFRHVSVTDFTSWFSFKKPNHYKFYKLQNWIKEKVINYGESDQVYIEWMTLDKTGDQITRKVEGLTEIFAKVGGLSHWLKVIVGFIFLKYSLISFKIDAIN